MIPIQIHRIKSITLGAPTHFPSKEEDMGFWHREVLIVHETVPGTDVSTRVDLFAPNREALEPEKPA